MIHQLRIYEIFERNKAAFHDRFRDHMDTLWAPLYDEKWGIYSNTTSSFVKRRRMQEETKPSLPPDTGRANGPPIRRLELLASVPLADMKAFYHPLLGLRLVEEQPERLTIAEGILI